MYTPVDYEARVGAPVHRPPEEGPTGGESPEAVNWKARMTGVAITLILLAIEASLIYGATTGGGTAIGCGIAAGLVFVGSSQAGKWVFNVKTEGGDSHYAKFFVNVLSGPFLPAYFLWNRPMASRQVNPD